MADLGDYVEDKVTGFKGIVMVKAESLPGCRSVFVVPRVLDDNVYRKGTWFDVQRVDVIGPGEVKLAGTS